MTKIASLLSPLLGAYDSLLLRPCPFIILMALCM